MATTFVFTGLDCDLDLLMQELVKRYEIKSRGRLESGSQDAKEVDILGLTVRLHERDTSWGADVLEPRDDLEEKSGWRRGRKP